MLVAFFCAFHTFINIALPSAGTFDIIAGVALLQSPTPIMHRQHHILHPLILVPQVNIVKLLRLLHTNLILYQYQQHHHHRNHSHASSKTCLICLLLIIGQLNGLTIDIYALQELASHLLRRKLHTTIIASMRIKFNLSVFDWAIYILKWKMLIFLVIWWLTLRKMKELLRHVLGNINSKYKDNK